MKLKQLITKTFLLYLMASSGCLLFTTFLEAQNIVIKAGHLFDSRTGKVLDKQTIIIKDGKILEVGSNLSYKSSDSVIDLSTSWVLPGLMDCHVHITDNQPYRNMNRNIPHGYFTESSSFRALRGGYVAAQFLAAGFTTIKEIGNDANYATADVIRAIKQGWINGTTIFYAGKIIAPYGGQSGDVNIENEHAWQFEYIDADTPEEIIKAVRRNIYYGANTIKMVTGDNGIYNVEDIKAAVDEAKKYGIKVTVHVADKAGATEVILGGAAAIEHGFGLDDTQLQMMKDKGIFLVGTDFSFDNWYAYGIDSTTAKAFTGKIADRLTRAYKIGTKMAFGTDIIVDIPGLNRVESGLKVLQTWKAAKIPPAYILQTMTLYAAELLGIEKTKGVIAPGFTADIIAIKNNPLDDIDAIKNVHFVMKDSKIIKQ